MPKLTPKQFVLFAELACTLDYYECLRRAGRPCWFIRHGLQGGAYTEICASPRAAWKAAYDGLMASFGKKAA